MSKKALLLFSTTALIASQAFAQYKTCATDEMHWKAVQEHPEIAVYEARMQKQIEEGLKHIDYSKLARSANKTTGNANNGIYYDTNDSQIYDIPIVVHIVHDYGNEDVSDDAIFNAFADWNRVYNAQNPDISSVIAPFKKYIGNPHIRLHLASRDPNGNPTKGITRRRSYLTYGTGSSSQSKMDDWAPTSYINIWFVNQLDAGSPAAAYALLPADAAAEPFYDGVISLYSYMQNTYTGDAGKTVNHEIGHVLNLQHPWGNTNNPEVACGDDAVDDTPPTIGHNPQGCTTSALTDTMCCQHYFKVYPSLYPGIDSIADYPDTANSQNIMDYTYCAEMFSKGQVERMHIALHSDIAGRNNLWDTTNLAATGALQARQELLPIPAYSAYQSGGALKYFTAVGVPIIFKDFSWNDTIQTAVWNFSNNASPSTRTDQSPSQVATPLTVNFGSAGWVDLNLTVTGNGQSASTPVTLNDVNSVYVTDSAGLDPSQYFEEFTVTGNDSKWPMFNYYNNNFKWQHANVGYYDNSSVMYTGYDTRLFPQTLTGSPRGDFDDLFSPSFNLSSFYGGKACNIDFMYSGASRTSISPDMNDTLEVDYTTDLTATWHVLKYLTKGQLINAGALSIPYAPLWMGDWSPMTLTVPAAALSTHTIFRFRYKPGLNANWATTGQYSTGNNFYMDRFSISSFTAGVNNVLPNEMGIAVVPNPTNGSAFVVVKDANNAPVQIRVTDITGKVVFVTEQTVNNGGRIEIPKSAIAVTGMYMVQVINNNQIHTEKLVVN